MIRSQPTSTLTDTRSPYTTLYRPPPNATATGNPTLPMPTTASFTSSIPCIPLAFHCGHGRPLSSFQELASLQGLASIHELGPAFHAAPVVVAIGDATRRRPDTAELPAVTGERPDAKAHHPGAGAQHEHIQWDRNVEALVETDRKS